MCRLLLVFLWLGFAFDTAWAAGGLDTPFPLPLDAYQDDHMTTLAKLSHPIEVDPFNLVAALIFLCAIIHTFFAGYFRNLSHKLQEKHVQKMIQQERIGKENRDVSSIARAFHFLGEVEAVFGIWVIALIAAITFFYGWHQAIDYVSYKVNYTEPMFIVVVMAISSTRPILNFSENMLRILANVGKQSVAAWWFVILTFAPILGSFITEPAAMTIAALLLGKQFYVLKPSNTFKYATLGLLFVNISVGGTLSNFAAPPVLMVAAKWGWSTPFMMQAFGWKAWIGIIIANVVYYAIFKKEFKALEHNKNNVNFAPDVEVTSDDQTNLVPAWVTMTHLFFLGWCVYAAHYPALFIGGFLFFLGFMHMTEQHQNRLSLEGPILVGFFLAGLVNHGGVQGWWIAPVLGALSETPLMIASIVLTSFNDNAAITYLSTLVPNFSDGMKYAVVAGAVTGGGLTVIANAPNPAGQSILARHFSRKHINPLGLLVGALFPTIVMALCFLWL